MADEEKTQHEQTEETAPAEEAAEPAAEEKAAEQPEAAADAPVDAAAPAAGGDSGEDEGKPTPKQLRKKQRSTFEGPAAEPRTAEQRAEERKAIRKAKAASRSRWRAKRREKKKAAGPGNAPEPVEREPAARKVRQGIVVSSKAEKTITVKIDNVRRHRVYGKVVHDTTTLHAHDERNEAGEGDVVRVIECRPLSRSKRWRLDEVLEKAK